MVTDMLTFVMQHAYCQFNGQFYQQIKGTVMGTPVAPPYSNIYIAQCPESRTGQTAERPGLGPAFISRRFIDDGLFIWEHDGASLLAFLHMLNNLLPNIWLTYNYSQSGIDYMDIGPSPTVWMHVSTAERCCGGCSQRTWR